ncbi:hypothetical protein M422DRAFT_67913 [Sphaerobolus stellatus SS14]|uniref:Uncharacterized protein n=1 Tax=Sphaerobolus stellatus (strain SS14) TaxID=990650 RepID=A0A0C9UJ19_SPHS4|nr:hypothetical protein M422DRAFT_67913 [Sphaerobolus stellatus SS14]
MITNPAQRSGSPFVVDYTKQPLTVRHPADLRPAAASQITPSNPPGLIHPGKIGLDGTVHRSAPGWYPAQNQLQVQSMAPARGVTRNSVSATLTSNRLMNEHWKATNKDYASGNFYHGNVPPCPPTRNLSLPPVNDPRSGVVINVGPAPSYPYVPQLYPTIEDNMNLMRNAFGPSYYDQ